MSKKRRTIGRYELGPKVATGGMAELYRAHLKGPYGFRKPVAIKLIRPELAQQKEFRNLFMHESRIMAAYNHRNLVQVFELGESSGQLFMSIEFIEGKDLSQILLERLLIAKPLAPSQAAFIAREVSHGLEYVHTMVDNDGNPQHIVHRDVNPGNILIAKDGQVKLGDFGIAKSTARQSQTKTGHVKGKLAYLSPEQARGEEVDAGSDIYSVGLILFEMLTLQTYIPESSQIEMLRQAANPTWRNIREINPQVPNSLENIVRRCLASQRCDRYVRAKDLSQALTLLLHQAQAAPDEIAALVNPRSSQQQRALVETTISPKLTPEPEASPNKITAPATKSPRKQFTRTVDMDIAPQPASNTSSSKRKTITLITSIAVMVLLGWIATAVYNPAPLELGPNEVKPIPLPQENTQAPLPAEEFIIRPPQDEAPTANAMQPTTPRSHKPKRKTHSKPNRVRASKNPIGIRAKKAEQALFAQLGQSLSTYRKKIRSIGLRPGDVPLIDRHLTSTQKSIVSRNTNAAQLHLRNLSKEIDSVRIDQKFIENKLKRLDRTLASLKHKNSYQEQIRDILDHTLKGRFQEANRAINKVYLSIQGRPPGSR